MAVLSVSEGGDFSQIQWCGVCQWFGFRLSQLRVVAVYWSTCVSVKCMCRLCTCACL